ncbi:MAG: hypothetical protein FOGNACKC_00892 [Anaerolineae bacterium]|nr:hypothetical protein [Anaerolineae bacterium]
MDPISAALIGGLAVGVASGLTDTGKKLIIDAYDALKAALRQKYGVDSELANAVEQLEKKPDSNSRQGMVQEEIAAAGADKDADLLAKAQALLDKLNEQPGGKTIIQQIASGSNIAQASHGGTATVTVNQPKE